MIADIASRVISLSNTDSVDRISTTVSACASSTNALIDALPIRLGKTNIIIPEFESTVNETCVGGFNALQAVAKEAMTLQRLRPFDLDRDGFVMGEGGTLVLEELEHAKARGAKIYAELVGGGVSADAYHMTAPHPEGLGAANIMNAALEDAGMTTKILITSSVHGASTPIGDPQKSNHQTVFRCLPHVNISSRKIHDRTSAQRCWCN